MTFEPLSRVALVDDDQPFRDALAERLALGGLSVVPFPSAEAALRAISEYARAHGILHVLLPPAALSGADAAALGFVPDATGCWLRSARPSPKSLG